MSLSAEQRERIADLVELQPTKNAELQERWDMDSGSEVHQYLESELSEYYYRNEDSLICATPEAEAIAGNGDVDLSERSVQGTELHAAVVAVLPGPEERPQSVVATLHDIQDAFDDSIFDGEERDPVDQVRSALHTLSDRGVVERVRKTVPTFRLVLERESITVETG